MGIYVNNSKLFKGKMSDDYSEVITSDGEIIKNSIENPVIEMSTYKYDFTSGRNVDDRMGWRTIDNDSTNPVTYQVFIPVMLTVRELSTTYIIAFKSDEAMIIGLETSSVNRKEIAKRLKWFSKTTVTGSTGKTNIIRCSNYEGPVTILHEHGVSDTKLISLLEELGYELLGDYGDNFIIPEKVYDEKIGYAYGNWWRIHSTNSCRYYKAIAEIPMTNGKATIELFRSDGTAVKVDLYDNGDMQGYKYTVNDLLLLGDNGDEYVPE